MHLLLVAGMSRNGIPKRVVRHGVGIELDDDELFGKKPIRPPKNVNQNIHTFDTDRRGGLVRQDSLTSPTFTRRRNPAITFERPKKKLRDSGSTDGTVPSISPDRVGLRRRKQRSYDTEEDRSLLTKQLAKPSLRSMSTIERKAEKSHRPAQISKSLPSHQPSTHEDVQAVASQPEWELRREHMEHSALTVEEAAAIASSGGSGPNRTVRGAPSLSSLACQAVRTALKNGQILELEDVPDAHLHELLTTTSLNANVLDRIESLYPSRVAIIDVVWAHFVHRTYGVDKRDEAEFSSWRAVHEHEVALRLAAFQHCRSLLRSSYAAAAATTSNGGRLRQVSTCRTPDAELRRRGSARKNTSPTLIEKLRSDYRRDKRRRPR